VEAGDGFEPSHTGLWARCSTVELARSRNEKPQDAWRLGARLLIVLCILRGGLRSGYTEFTVTVCTVKCFPRAHQNQLPQAGL